MEDFLSLLPGSSFVPFTARRLAHPNIVWANEDADRSFDILEHTFCGPIEGEPTTAFAAELKEYFAERYGGRGVGLNGGGARCGTTGLVQIKGIGKTPLVGVKSTEAEHSYGGASLQEAVREALWGEICHIALPFGAIRSFGIIETGTHVRNFGLRDRIGMTPRALVLRQPVLRPAHFMRAPGFTPQAQVGVSDVERTRAAVAVFPMLLRSIFSCDFASANGSVGITRCLMELSRRFAWQQAAAQAKRLIHGALASTNIALDGRWLDFGTIGMASDYGRAVVSTQPDAWLQFTSLIEPLQDLVFHLGKYLPTHSDKIPAANDLIQEYLRTLGGRLSIEFDKLTGIPEAAVGRLPPAMIERFGICVQMIIARGNRYPFDLYARGRPAKSGRFHLNTLLRIAALTGSPDETEVALADHISGGPLREEFVESYWALRLAYLQSTADSSQNSAAHLTLNAIRVNTIIEDLCRPALDDHIERLIAGEGVVADFIAALVRKAKTFLSEPKDGFMNIDAFCIKAAGSTVSRQVEVGDDACASAVLSSLPDKYFAGMERRLTLLADGVRT